MPPAPAFDYYDELQVGRDASPEEVTASYRRLARLHHPDKNPGNLEQATATFQKIALAYEVLSDSAQRARYDARSSSGGGAASSSRSRPSHYYEDEYDYEYDDDYDDDDEFEYEYHREFPDQFFHFHFPGGGGGGGAYYFNPFSNRPPMDRAEVEAMRKRQEEKEKMWFEAMQQERREHEAAEAERRRTKQAAKQAEEAAKNQEKAGRRAEEQAKQQSRWEKTGAKTAEDKLASCLHSDFCAKVTHKQKVKCGACAAKRGMTAFECPYCAVFLCQLCVTKSSERRAKLEKMPEPPKAEPVLDPESMKEPEPVPEWQRKPTGGKADGGKKKPAGNPGGRFKKGRAPGKTNGTGDRTCYNCGAEGHKAKECPDRNQPKSQQQQQQQKKKKAGNAKGENGAQK